MSIESGSVRRCTNCNRVLQGMFPTCNWCGAKVKKTPQQKLWKQIREGKKKAVSVLLDLNEPKTVDELLELLENDTRFKLRTEIVKQMLA